MTYAFHCQCHPGGCPSSVATTASGPSMSLLRDMRHHLNRKWSLKQVIIHHCACKEFITTMVFECQYNTPPRRVLVFEKLSETPKRHCAHHKSLISNEEYLKVTVNMTGHGRERSAAPRYNIAQETERDCVYCQTRVHDN